MCISEEDRVFSEGEGVSEGDMKIRTVEELIDRIVGSKTGWFLALLAVFSMSYSLAGMSLIYHPIFTGTIPYSEWKCISAHCTELFLNSSTEEPFYGRSSLCNNNLQPDVDFTWTSNRTSFALDWGLYCERETEGSSVNGLFFVGALIGLLAGSPLQDRLGRRTVVLGSSLVSIVPSLGQVFARSVGTMLCLRVVQGLGVSMSLACMFVWAVEYTPQRLRNKANTILSLFMVIGTLLLILVSYLITDWRDIVLVLTLLGAASYIPLLLLPESPRFQVVHGNTEQALETLRTMATILGSSLPENVTLMRPVHRKPSHNGILHQLRDFKKYPKMLRMILILFVHWFLLSFIYDGLSFGWHKMSDDIFVSMCLAQVSYLVACLGTGLVIARLGRRMSQCVFFSGISVCFFLAVPDIQFSEGWTLNMVACLFAITFITAATVTVYLYTAELAPTSHRGLIICLCSGVARVGSILGPYVSLLYEVADRRMVMGILGVAGGAAAGLTWLLDETAGIPPPDTPADIVERRGANRYQTI